MKFVERLKQKTENNPENRTPIIAFLGDSVTQGCFEVYRDNGRIRTVFDSGEAYSEKIKKILGMLYPEAPVSIMNFGINGGSATEGVERFRRDVLSCNPDLLVVCFGLNDSNGEEAGLSVYRTALTSIFLKTKQAGIETIFMTPNMFNTYANQYLVDESFQSIAEMFATRQNEGVFDAYMETAREVCKEQGIKICDCYALWKQMNACGVDTTQLLANGMNHPIRPMHYMFAWELVSKILELK